MPTYEALFAEHQTSIPTAKLDAQISTWEEVFGAYQTNIPAVAPTPVPNTAHEVTSGIPITCAVFLVLATACAVGYLLGWLLRSIVFFRSHEVRIRSALGLSAVLWVTVLLGLSTLFRSTPNLAGELGAAASGGVSGSLTLGFFYGLRRNRTQSFTGHSSSPQASSDGCGRAAVTTPEEEAFFDQAAKEVGGKSVRKGLYEKALCLAEGNQEQARYKYIALRSAQLIDEHRKLAARKARRVIVHSSVWLGCVIWYLLVFFLWEHIPPFATWFCGLYGAFLIVFGVPMGVLKIWMEVYWPDKPA